LYFNRINSYRMAKEKEQAESEIAKKKAQQSLQNSVYLDPLTDFGFKHLFTNKELLIPFLNEIMGMDIKDIEYKPNEGLGWIKEERTTIFDLQCTTRNDEHFIVEMQLGDQKYFRDRILVYGSHMIRKQAPRKKNWNYNIKPVYIVSILNFKIFKDQASENQVIERVYLYRESTKKLFTNKLQFVFIQLPKFQKAISELANDTDRWLYVLKNLNGLESSPPELKDKKPFDLLLEIAEIKQLTEEEMERYQVSLAKSYQLRSAINYAREEAREDEKMAIAIKLLMLKHPIDEIISLTELSREAVMSLIKKLPQA